MELMKPKFKFGLYLVDTAKASYHNKNTPQQHVVCFAESYEIQADGSIIFFQILKGQDDKKMKVPVLAYPSGKWEACVLMDAQNDFPVFTYRSKGLGLSNNSSGSNSSGSSLSSIQEESHNLEYVGNQKDEVAQLDEMFGTNIVPTGYQNNQSNSNNNSMSMPGVNQGNNPQEFKKQKEDWLEIELKSYLKNNEFFKVEEFLNYIKSNAQNRKFKAQESEVVWACSKLIKNKQTMVKKFYVATTQKILGLILPDIMKRQWDGKMAPILQVLNEREETKNVNAIDLAVWMVQNNFIE